MVTLVHYLPSVKPQTDKTSDYLVNTGAFRSKTELVGTKDELKIECILDFFEWTQT